MTDENGKFGYLKKSTVTINAEITAEDDETALEVLTKYVGVLFVDACKGESIEVKRDPDAHLEGLAHYDGTCVIIPHCDGFTR